MPQSGENLHSLEEIHKQPSIPVLLQFCNKSASNCTQLLSYLLIIFGPPPPPFPATNDILANWPKYHRFKPNTTPISAFSERPSLGRNLSAWNYCRQNNSVDGPVSASHSVLTLKLTGQHQPGTRAFPPHKTSLFMMPSAPFPDALLTRRQRKPRTAAWEWMRPWRFSPTKTQNGGGRSGVGEDRQRLKRRRIDNKNSTYWSVRWRHCWGAGQRLAVSRHKLTAT